MALKVVRTVASRWRVDRTPPARSLCEPSRFAPRSDARRISLQFGPSGYDTNVNDPNEGRDHTIHNPRRIRRLLVRKGRSKLEPKTAVDDADRDQSPASPQMCLGKKGDAWEPGTKQVVCQSAE